MKSKQKRKRRGETPAEQDEKHAWYIKKLKGKLREINKCWAQLPFDSSKHPIQRISIVYKGPKKNWFKDCGEKITEHGGTCNLLIEVKGLSEDGVSANLDTDAKIFQWLLWEPFLGTTMTGEARRIMDYKSSGFKCPAHFFSNLFETNDWKQVYARLDGNWQAKIAFPDVDMKAFCKEVINKRNTTLQGKIDRWLSGLRWDGVWDWEELAEKTIFGSHNALNTYWEPAGIDIPKSWKISELWSPTNQDVNRIFARYLGQKLPKPDPYIRKLQESVEESSPTHNISKDFSDLFENRYKALHQAELKRKMDSNFRTNEKIRPPIIKTPTFTAVPAPQKAPTTPVKKQSTMPIVGAVPGLWTRKPGSIFFYTAVPVPAEYLTMITNGRGLNAAMLREKALNPQGFHGPSKYGLAEPEVKLPLKKETPKATVVKTKPLLETAKKLKPMRGGSPARGVKSEKGPKSALRCFFCWDEEGPIWARLADRPGHYVEHFCKALGKTTIRQVGSSSKNPPPSLRCPLMHQHQNTYCMTWVSKAEAKKNNWKPPTK